MYALHIPEVRVGGASGDAFYTHLIFRGRCRPFVVLLLLLTTETSHLRESLEGHQVETAVVSHGARHAFCLFLPSGFDLNLQAGVEAELSHIVRFGHGRWYPGGDRIVGRRCSFSLSLAR